MHFKTKKSNNWTKTKCCDENQNGKTYFCRKRLHGITPRKNGGPGLTLSSFLEIAHIIFTGEDIIDGSKIIKGDVCQ